MVGVSVSRRSLGLVLLLLLSLGMHLWAGGPDIEFEELVYNFGEVEPGQVVTHVYEFENRGDEELTVSKVRACCGVRAYLLTPEVVAPGARGEIRVTYHPKGGEGVRTKRIKVRSNDPDEPLIELRITGLVRPVLSVTPRSLLFGDVPRGEERKGELTILPVGNISLGSVEVKSSTRWLAAEVIETAEGEKKGFRVLVTLETDAPPGDLSETIELEADVGEKKLVKVPVHAKIVGEISGVRSAGESGPAIHFIEIVYDFGVAKQGDVITHIYKFGNIGARELNISDVKSCCGARASLLSPSIIPPGGEGEVEVTFHTEGREGRQTKTVRVHSNDEDEPIVELRLTGAVQSTISVTPERILFGEVPRGEERREELKVVPLGGEKPIIVKSSAQHLTTEVVETGREGKEGVKVLVILRADAPCGELRERLEIQSGVGDGSSVAVPVYAKVKGNISVVPEALSFRGVGRGDMISRKLAVSSRDGKHFDILGVDSDLRFISGEVSSMEEGRSYEVVLNLKIEDLSEVRNGKVFIHTGDPKERVIEVPLTFYKVRR